MADNGSPMIIRTYITCPDCGRTGPDVDGRCQDCHDHARLRDAVAEWAREAYAPGLAGYFNACDQLHALARELGLVDA